MGALGRWSAVSGQRSAGLGGVRRAWAGLGVRRSAGGGISLKCRSSCGLGHFGRCFRSAGSGTSGVKCARGGSAALVVSVGRPPCVLARFALCARCGVLPPRRLVCLPLRAPCRPSLPSLRLSTAPPSLPSLRLSTAPPSLPSLRSPSEPPLCPSPSHSQALAIAKNPHSSRSRCRGLDV